MEKTSTPIESARQKSYVVIHSPVGQQGRSRRNRGSPKTMCKCSEAQELAFIVAEDVLLLINVDFPVPFRPSENQRIKGSQDRRNPKGGISPSKDLGKGFRSVETSSRALAFS